MLSVRAALLVVLVLATQARPLPPASGADVSVRVALPKDKHLVATVGHLVVDAPVPAVLSNPTALSAAAAQQGNGTCPNPGLVSECPVDELCCPDQCCDDDFPFCLVVGGICSDENSLVPCVNSQTGQETKCTLCVAWSLAEDELRGCPVDTDYRFCGLGPEFLCRNEDGFIDCEGSPGVVCPGGKTCCRDPLRCDENSDTCSAGGSGAPQPVEPVAKIVPASTPSATHSPVAPSASPGALEDPLAS